MPALIGADRPPVDVVSVERCCECHRVLSRWNQGPECWACYERAKAAGVERAVEELVTAATIAERFGCATSTVANWRVESDFPLPVETKRGAYAARFEWRAVRAWARAHGRRPLS